MTLFSILVVLFSILCAFTGWYWIMAFFKRTFRHKVCSEDFGKGCVFSALMTGVVLLAGGMSHKDPNEPIYVLGYGFVLLPVLFALFIGLSKIHDKITEV